MQIVLKEDCDFFASTSSEPNNILSLWLDITSSINCNKL